MTVKELIIKLQNLPEAIKDAPIVVNSHGRYIADEVYILEDVRVGAHVVSNHDVECPFAVEIN